MDHFTYHNDILHAEGVDLRAIAKAVGTPFYVYSDATLVRHYTVFAESFARVNAKVFFAVKANSNLAVLKTLAGQGAGADTVSEGEIRRALAAGIKPQDIVFSGVGKTEAEMAYGLEVGIYQFNVESVQELERLNEVAGSRGQKAPVALRVNPDVDAITHEKITTGRKDDKFGIPYDDIRSAYALAAKLEHIEIVGITTHIGSQLTDLTPFQTAFQRVANLVAELKQQGYPIERIDVGGGLGIPYLKESPPLPHEYAEIVIGCTQGLDCELGLEPGRMICGNAGLLVTEVIMVKETSHRRFTVVDAAMNDLMRAALYDAYHDIIPVENAQSDEHVISDIVGPVCETTDIFRKDVALPPLAAGDLLAFRTAGAYGAVMSNTYNTRPLIAEVMVKGDLFAVVRPRQSYEELLGQDLIPDW